MSRVVDNDTLATILRDYERRIRLLETAATITDAPDAGAITSNSTGAAGVVATGTYAQLTGTATSTFTVTRPSRIILLGTLTATTLPSTGGTYAYCRIVLRNTALALICASLPSVIQHATADRYTSLPLHVARSVAAGSYVASIEVFGDTGIQLTWTYAEVDAMVIGDY